MKTGIELIAAERERQITAEGWSAAHDDQYKKREMVLAAVCYANFTSTDALYQSGLNLAQKGWSPLAWPWPKQWWKPSDPIRDLVKAGALIAAEIDRIQREDDANRLWRSTCCGAESIEHSMDIGMCPDCKEHCEYELS